MTAPAPASAATTVEDLHRVLQVALLFASRDDHLPSVCGVALAAGGGVLTGTATNRFVLGHMRASGSGSLPEVVVPYEHAKILVNTLGKVGKPARQANASLTVEQRPLGRRLAVTTPGFDIAVELRDPSVVFPDVARLVGNTAAAETDTSQPILLSPSNMLPFARAHKLLEQPLTRWSFASPTKPVRIEIGDTFVGLAMPVRPHDLQHLSWPVPFGLPAQPSEASA